MLRSISAAIAGLFSVGCFWAAPSRGGGEVEDVEGRKIIASDIALPDGYVVEPVAAALTFPTSITFDGAGRVHVIEAGYSYGEKFGTARLLRLEGGRFTVVATSNNGPWTGVVFHEGAFYVAEGGQREGGKILRIDPDGKITALVEQLPSVGDHHTNGPAVGPDGFVYFGQGTATNSGIVGPDNAEFGWLKRHPRFHDVPCKDVSLTGANFESDDAISGSNAKVRTGAFSAYGTSSSAGQVIAGQVPCSGAVLRVPIAGGKPELVAWGFRNPFGLAFGPDRQLYVTDNAYDERGSRPVFGTGDVLWKVTPGTWYGWPDFAEGRAVYTEDFEPPGSPKPARLLAVHPNVPPKPVARFGVHSSSNGIDFARSARFGYAGQAFVAQFGDQAPKVGKTMNPVGFKVIRVDLSTGVSHDFAVNRGGQNGPASMLKAGGLERPVALRFTPNGDELYVVDFGIMTVSDQGIAPREKTGVIWRIRRGP